MKNIKLLLLCFLIVNQANSQEISLRLNSITSVSRQEKVLIDTLSEIPQISEKFHSLNMDLSYSHYLNSKVKLLCRIGVIE